MFTVSSLNVWISWYLTLIYRCDLCAWRVLRFLCLETLIFAGRLFVPHRSIICWYCYVRWRLHPSWYIAAIILWDSSSQLYYIKAKVEGSDCWKKNAGAFTQDRTAEKRWCSCACIVTFISNGRLSVVWCCVEDGVKLEIEVILMKMEYKPVAAWRPACDFSFWQHF